MLQACVEIIKFMMLNRQRRLIQEDFFPGGAGVLAVKFIFNGL